MLKSIGAAACVLCASGAIAKPVIVEFDAPGAAQTYVSGVNRYGALSGVYVLGNGHADGYMRKSDGTYVFFSQAGTFPEAIDLNSETAGYTLDSNSDAFVASAAGAVTAFSPHGATNQFGSSAEAMNVKGESAGFYTDKNFHVHGFVRGGAGHIATFDAPGAGTGSHQGTFVYGLSDIETAAGYIIDTPGAYHGFVRDKDGNVTSFDVDGAGTASGQGTRVLCMSEHGTAGGTYVTADGVKHGFLRAANGAITTFDVPGATATVVKSINGGSTSVGFYVDASGVSHGFSRNGKGHISKIDAPDAGSASGQGTTATGVNDKNEIVGFYFDSAGLQHGFVQTR